MLWVRGQPDVTPSHRGQIFILIPLLQYIKLSMDSCWMGDHIKSSKASSWVGDEIRRRIPLNYLFIYANP